MWVAVFKSEMMLLYSCLFWELFLWVDTRQVSTWAFWRRSISTDCELGEHGFIYPWRYNTNGSVFSGVFNNETRCRNGVMSYFQTNLDSVYNIMMDASVVGGILNTYCRRAFDIIILTNHVVWCYGVTLESRLSHLLFPLAILQTAAYTFLLW